ncbi:hypothetical protein M8C21_008906 [Ambrosia artemisiifolia]|uniref:Uncharacterized protein n=1 Tax=Ambrosia artemisiifolia TaxID=4212 RepID=A0AAD5GRM2_AMBAR|nr:hypothetical protein M8C21_008906 [Ambrosia artemisiifolia]
MIMEHNHITLLNFVQNEIFPCRPDLRVVLMSANLDASLFSDYLVQNGLVQNGDTWAVELNNTHKELAQFTCECERHTGIQSGGMDQGQFTSSDNLVQQYTVWEKFFHGSTRMSYYLPKKKSVAHSNGAEPSPRVPNVLAGRDIKLLADTPEELNAQYRATWEMEL